jgi:hypothetical protein
MKNTLTVVVVLAIVSLASWACGKQTSNATADSQANSSQSGNAGAGNIHFKVPDGWMSEKPTSSMRVEQYKLPKVEDDKDDALLVVYFFGATQGGATQANIDRWISQIQQPDGSDSKSKAKTESLTINGLKVSTVDVAGTYTAEMAPGTGQQRNDPNYRLRAAVIETPKGNYFIKLVGPAKTVAHWEQSYNDYLKSAEFK